jgi:hypothetical protein
MIPELERDSKHRSDAINGPSEVSSVPEHGRAGADEGIL